MVIQLRRCHIGGQIVIQHPKESYLWSDGDTTPKVSYLWSDGDITPKVLY